MLTRIRKHNMALIRGIKQQCKEETAPMTQIYMLSVLLPGVCPGCCLMRGCVWLLWPCQMDWWTAWIQTAVCRQPVTPPLCVWAPRTPWTSSRRHRCPLHRATCRLSMTGCASWWAGTAPTSSPVPTPLMESEWLVHYSHLTPRSPTVVREKLFLPLVGEGWHQYYIDFLFLHQHLFFMHQHLVRFSFSLISLSQLY